MHSTTTLIMLMFEIQENSSNAEHSTNANATYRHKWGEWGGVGGTVQRYALSRILSLSRRSACIRAEVPIHPIT